MNLARYFSLLACFVVILSGKSASCDVRLPKVINNGMVLQRGLEAPIWGWAAPGEKVTVEFAGDKREAVADNDGGWIVRLPKSTANDKGQPLVIRGNNEIRLVDVLVGDVWICSGQSNMEWSVRISMNSGPETAAAKFPNIRLFDVPGHTTSPLAKEDVPGGQWSRCQPQTVANFSAVGYYFGRHIHRETGVPVGLIGTNWGGTRIEPWIPPVGFRQVKELKGLSNAVDQFDPSTEAGKKTWTTYADAVESWVQKARTSIKDGKSLVAPPEAPGFRNAGQPTAIYNSMVHGLAPFGVRGAIWYQGESNGGEGESYYHKMQALIKGWRSVWGQGEFPFYFYFVQLANFQKPNENPAGGDGWARIRDAQRKTLTVPHTGMAVITDIGAANDIHPRNKQDVGKRLAMWALRDVGGKDVVVSGPLFREQKIEGDKIRLEFDHTGRGLMVGKKDGLKPTEQSDQSLARFAIAGKDRKWHWAEAEIDGDTVVVSSTEVKQPVAVRYGWSMNPEGANLYNKEGLPASPFRTDSW